MPSLVRRILLVDDDPFQLSLLARHLSTGGFETNSASSVTTALALIESTAFDLVIIDVRMPDDGVFSSLETHSGWETGIPLANAIRQRQPGVKIIAYTVSRAVEIQDWFTRDSGVGYLLKEETSKKQLLRTVNRMLGFRGETPQMFIVHGRDRVVFELQHYLKDVLKLGEPIVLAEKPLRGKTLIEKFEHYAAGTDVAFVLVTPDDTGSLIVSSDALQPRARQNVIFELGYFCGYLRRSSGRVILLHKGFMEMPSDVSGVCYIDITRGITEAGEEIRRELAEWL
jgi:predicted nucleotide-binding protein